MEKPKPIDGQMYYAPIMDAYITDLNNKIAIQKSIVSDLEQKLNVMTGANLELEKEALRKTVLMFAGVMINKLTKKVNEGYEGWHNDGWFIDHIIADIKKEVNKPTIDPVDLANYSMFLWTKQQQLREENYE